MNGKPYASRRKEEHRPEGDFYGTPASLVWSLLDNVKIPLIEASKRKFNPGPKPTFYDPAVGDGALLKALGARGYGGRGSDLFPVDGSDPVDFLCHTQSVDPKKEILIMNPPFSLFDDFIFRAKAVTPYFITLGRVNFFGTHKRNVRGLWTNLRSVHVFDRMVDYRTANREDGHFSVGALVTCWMVFDRSWKKPYWETSLLDVNEFATLGQVKEES